MPKNSLGKSPPEESRYNRKVGIGRQGAGATCAAAAARACLKRLEFMSLPKPTRSIM